MSTTIVTESMAIAAAETPTVVAKLTAPPELFFAVCECCGLTEECTSGYIDGVRELYQGKWICGLCAEAVKDEIVRSEMLIADDEALDRHMRFCREFRSSVPPSNAAASVHLIAAVRQILRRSSLKSSPASSTNGICADDVENLS